MVSYLSVNPCFPVRLIGTCPVRLLFCRKLRRETGIRRGYNVFERVMGDVEIQTYTSLNICKFPRDGGINPLS